MLPSLKEIFLIAVADAQTRLLLQRMLSTENRELVFAQSNEEVRKVAGTIVPALIISTERLPDGDSLDLIAELASRFPACPAILLLEDEQPDILKKALRCGISEFLTYPLRVDEINQAINRCLTRISHQRVWMRNEAKRITATLQQRVDELETLAKIGRSITSKLSLDAVLTSIVALAVELTGSEEGNLLLIDETTGELYMRASRNFHDEFVRTFRLPVKDSMISSVIQTGQPFLLDEKTPKKIKTAYLVQSLVYVPLTLKDRTIGALGVDNQMSHKPFGQRDIKLLKALAEYAVIALENARLFSETEQERKKLETVVAGIQDGVLAINPENQIILFNEAVRNAIGLPSGKLTGKTVREIISNPEILGFIEAGESTLSHLEFQTPEGRFFDIQKIPITGVGKVITLHDITNLKQLDRMKSDFVNTVSHDLRSPLTAILGYIELIKRVGPLNSQQQEFSERLLASIQNITTLVNELLNLGRIEAGLDTRREQFQLSQVILNSMDSFRSLAAGRNINLEYQLDEKLPLILANPVQMRQMIDNLLDNASKYTPPSGTIGVRTMQEGEQVILQVADTGIGIPVVDRPYIFDKFYRGSNVGREMTGSGLGLSIVKSIVEGHNGRIWVDSSPGRGTIFTVVLPLNN